MHQLKHKDVRLMLLWLDREHHNPGDGRWWPWDSTSASLHLSPCTGSHRLLGQGTGFPTVGHWRPHEEKAGSLGLGSVGLAPNQLVRPLWQQWSLIRIPGDLRVWHTVMFGIHKYKYIVFILCIHLISTWHRTLFTGRAPVILLTFL